MFGHVVLVDLVFASLLDFSPVHRPIEFLCAFQAQQTAANESHASSLVQDPDAVNLRVDVAGADVAVAAEAELAPVAAPAAAASVEVAAAADAVEGVPNTLYGRAKSAAWNTGVCVFWGMRVIYVFICWLVGFDFHVND